MKEVKRVIQNTHKNITELATNSDRYKKSEIFKKKKKCMGGSTGLLELTRWREVGVQVDPEREV